MGEQLVRWKQELDRWQNEYIVDWQLHFEQYKKYQSYRYADSDNAQCWSTYGDVFGECDF